jgi:uncharacterized protein YjhX (UPF0386 family)
MSKYFKAFNAIKNLVKPKKVAETITSVKPAKNLKKRADVKEMLVKGVDTHGKNMTVAQKGKFKAEGSKEISGIFDKYEKLSEGLKKGTVVARKAENKAKGGRIGFKKGSGRTGVPAVDIKSTPAKKLSEKQKKIASLAGNPKKIDKPDFKVLRNKNKNKRII